MHITSGLSPASGEMLDTCIDFYGDSGEQFGATYFAVDHAVPESSHTVEIEYVCEQPETYAQKTLEAKKGIKERKKPPDFKKLRLQKPEGMAIEVEPEPDLTNLNWLQNITNIMSVPQFPISPMSPAPPLKPQPPPNTRLQKFNKTIAKCQEDYMENREEYQRNSEKKPPYSYSTLICMAMRYNNDKMTLSAIYAWIKENFKYYRHADPTWQNSIRHNLSLNKVFVKEARSKQEPGKGGFWKLDLGHLEGTKRVSNRPHKRKKTPKIDIKDSQSNEEKTAVANIPAMQGVEIHIGPDTEVNLHLPEFNMQTLSMGMEVNVGANVIVEPAVPPPLLVEDDLTSLLLNPTDWDDLQLDMFDNYLDSCFK